MAHYSTYTDKFVWPPATEDILYTDSSYSSTSRYISPTERYAHLLMRQPVPVYWAGWESDTLKLANSGWKLAAEEDPMKNLLQLCAHHPQLDLWSISNPHPWREFMRPALDATGADFAGLHIVFSQVSRGGIEVIHHGSSPKFDFKEIAYNDTNVYAPIDQTRITQKDLRIFPTIEAAQILVDKADMSVVEHLEAIKSLQSDKQRELREKARRESDQEGRTNIQQGVVAELISFREAA